MFESLLAGSLLYETIQMIVQNASIPARCPLKSNECAGNINVTMSNLTLPEINSPTAAFEDLGQ